jgi:hypothetical protein
MKLMLGLCLIIGSSALKMKIEKPPAMALKALAHSSTRSAKAFCKDASQIQNGTWVLLEEGEYQAAPKVCNPELMMWEPETCKLPYHSNEVGQNLGRVVIIGDSITDNAARSFAWFYGESQGKERNACQYSKGNFKSKIQPQLEQINLKQSQVSDTLNYIEANGFRKNHHWWGCDSNVMYIPSDSPPPSNAVRGFMHAVKHFSKEPLGPQDTIVLNWGAWEKEDKEGAWSGNMKGFMKEYAKWQKEKTAPKLIWREMSPMHWGADGGKYTKQAFKDTQVTNGCSKMGLKQIERQMQNKNEFPSSNTRMFKNALKEAGLQIDGVNVEFLPVWRGSAERYEDHQLLSKYQKANHATIDCTHYCVHGNVHRFWNAALVSTISSMKEKA